MTQNEIAEIMRLLDESDITTWPLEDQLAISAAYLALANTVPIVLRNASKDDKAIFLFKVRKG